MPPVSFSIGSESFREIRKKHSCYVDKASIFEEMFKHGVSKVSLITRPRRFEQTLALDMMQEFFDIRASNSALFEGLVVSGNKEICKQWMNRRPTIFISFKDVNGIVLSIHMPCLKISSPKFFLSINTF
ncbi:MAG: AAA family ATPase [Desulfovibrio sp.]|nr:AAA family ATPase [Desulfovibrio sp.]